MLTPGMPGKMLTTREVAELLQVDLSTVTRWIRYGRLPAIRTPGGQYRVRREDVERLLGRPVEDR